MRFGEKGGLPGGDLDGGVGLKDPRSLLFLEGAAQEHVLEGDLFGCVTAAAGFNAQRSERLHTLT